MTLLDEALTLLRELRPHAPIESAWLTDPNARFDEEAWRNSPVATSSKMRDRIDDLLARASQETGTARRCRCGQVEWEDGARRISCGDGSDHYVDLDCVSAANR